MMCTTPECSGGVSYNSPTEHDESIQFTCNGCGQQWEEPNPRYAEQLKRDVEEEYYNRFRT